MKYTFGHTMFPSVGRCIYCQATENLSDEHIIPLSLGGEFILRDASCPTCAKVTANFEQLCARGIYGPLRIAHDYPTRRRRERPKLLPIKIEHNGITQERMISVDEYPASPVIAPVFPIAGILAGRAPSNDIPDIQYKFALPIPHDHNKRLQKLRGDGATNVILKIRFGLNPFMRLLAKVAHGLAVAEYGLDDLQPILPDYILDRDTRLSHVIGTVQHEINLPPGSTYENDAISRHAYQIGIRSMGDQHYVSILLQLFRYLNLPVYEIIAGRPSPQLLRRVLGDSSRNTIIIR